MPEDGTKRTPVLQQIDGEAGPVAGTIDRDENDQPDEVTAD